MIHGLVSPAFTITRLLVLTMSKATHEIGICAKFLK